MGPAEMLRYAAAKGYQAIGLTDHVSDTSLEKILPRIIEACAEMRSTGKVLAIPGVEITGIAPELIAETAKRAKELGAWIVVAHGETIVEIVAKGTNLAPISRSRPAGGTA
jgi:histidinol phosphatase-like PHP family hydrolase